MIDKSDVLYVELYCATLTGLLANPNGQREVYIDGEFGPINFVKKHPSQIVKEAESIANEAYKVIKETEEAK